MGQIICDGCGQYESECRCPPETTYVTVAPCECFRCAFLVSRGDARVPAWFVSNTVYTCANGRYTPRETKHGTYYALSGIIKPNKAVKKAQTDCPSFEEK